MQGVVPAELETWQTETDTHTHFCTFDKCKLSLSPLLLVTVCNPMLLYYKSHLVSINFSVGSDCSVTLTWFSTWHASQSTHSCPVQTQSQKEMTGRTTGRKKCPLSCWDHPHDRIKTSTANNGDVVQGGKFPLCCL